MRATFFINGFSEHGIVRASNLIAEAVAETQEHDVAIIRRDDPCPGELTPGETAALSKADVIFVHASPRTAGLWGLPAERAANIAAFARRWNGRIVVFLHDIYGDNRATRITKAVSDALGRTEGGGFREAAQNLRSALRGTAEQKLLSAVARTARLAIVMSEHEYVHVAATGNRNVVLLPHFIEARRNLIDKQTAKKNLNLDGHIVVGMLGYIHPRKGHDLALDVLRRLPPDYKLVMVGRPATDSSPFYRDLLERLAEDGLEHRVRITGYITEEVLDAYLSAMDVALCPYREAAASGSLSTLIAAGVPIVTSNLPEFRSQVSEFGNLISIGEDLGSMAAAIMSALARGRPAGYDIRDILEHRSLPNTAARLSALIDEIMA